MIEQFCEYTQKHWIVGFKLVDFMVHKLCLNKAIFKACNNKCKEKNHPIPKVL